MDVTILKVIKHTHLYIQKYTNYLEKHASIQKQERASEVESIYQSPLQKQIHKNIDASRPNNSTYTIKKISPGVPQGSFLSRRWFSVYVNNKPLVKEAKLALFTNAQFLNFRARLILSFFSYALLRLNKILLNVEQ